MSAPTNAPAANRLSLGTASVLLDNIYRQRAGQLGTDRAVSFDALTVDDVQHVCAVFNLDLQVSEILELALAVTTPEGARQ